MLTPPETLLHRRQPSSNNDRYVHVVGAARRTSFSARRNSTNNHNNNRGSRGTMPSADSSKSVRSRADRGGGSFATFMIIGPTCFFLGILFAMFPYDFPLLWTSAPVPASYYDQMETHLRFMHGAPPLIARLLNIIVFVGFSGFFIKLFKPSESNMLFDGASLVLYVIGVGIYIANIVKGLRAASSGIWHTEEFQGTSHSGPVTGEILLGREDSLKVMAASNTILALVLVGVLVLQAGQWYAERKDIEEMERMEEEKAKKK